MRRALKFALPLLVAVAVVLVAMTYLHGHTVDVLQPAGQVGAKERNLIIFALLLSVIVVVPTFALTIFIAWRYSEANAKPKKYNPDWDRSRLFESIWWGIPIVIIAVLSVVAWNSAHDLDPYKALVSNKKPLTIQVVAMDWKWLFIYPDQHVASVNQVEVPVDTPIAFQVTSDSVMNSFWVPRLGGQVYAMPGMSTQLHLMASQPGDYFGTPANISGKGFSRMNFTVRAVSQTDYDTWLHHTQHDNRNLTTSVYAKLAKPSDSVPVASYSPVQDGLYNDVLMQYMMPNMGMSTSDRSPLTLPTNQATTPVKPTTRPPATKQHDMSDMDMQGMAM